MVKAKKEVNIDYDFENDSLFIFPKSRNPEDYKISEYIDENFIFDLDKSDKIIGIEILFASKRFNLPKYAIQSASNWDFLIVVDEKTIKIEIKFKSNIRNQITEKDLSLEKINENLLTPSIANLGVC